MPASGHRTCRRLAHELQTPFRCVLAAAVAVIAAACADRMGENEPQATEVTWQALYAPPECNSQCVADGVLDAVARASAKYHLPRWFYYAIIARESGFDRRAVNTSDCGRGLTQLTPNSCAMSGDSSGSMLGAPYPDDLSTPDNSHLQWVYDEGLNQPQFANWINMNDVSALASHDDAFNPDPNLNRFSSGYAAPAYFLFQSGSDPVENLRRVAFHWNKGIFQAYDPNDQTYLGGAYGYDYWVTRYKAAVEADDGVWSGPPARPPYTGSPPPPPPPPPSSPSFSATAAAAPSCVVSGGVTAITAQFTDTGGPLTNGIVDIEVYDASHTMVGQGYATKSFSTNQTVPFTYNWTAPTTLNGPYHIELGVFGPGWTPNYYWNSNAGPITVSADNAKYNFECGGSQNWTFASGGIVASIGTSTARAYAGSSSLAVNFRGTAAGYQDVYSATSPLPGPGKVVTFHVWVPAGSGISAVQPYVMEGPAGNWNWTGTWKDITELTAGAWNTITVTVPATAAPLDSLGVELWTSGAWTGTCYVDSVTW